MAEKLTSEAAEAAKYLRRLLKPGDTVYCVLRSVSGSGMSRRLDFYVFRKNQPLFLSGYIGHLLGYSRGKGDGLLVQGCGMDMGFHVVYSLSRTLFPKGFKVTPKTMHRNGIPNGATDEDGGYALFHRWM